MLSALNTGFANIATFSIDSSGALVVTTASGYENYKPVVRSDTTNRSSTTVIFSDLFGLGDRYREDAARGLNVLSAIRNDTSQLALADLDLSAATGIPALSPGDARGAVSFQGSSIPVSASRRLATLPPSRPPWSPSATR